MKKLFLLFFLLIYSTSLFALSACELGYLSSEQHLNHFVEENKIWFLKLKELELEASSVLKLSELSQDVKGAVNSGIYLAKTDRGEDVLKMISDTYLDKYGYKILLQKHFAELGLAPKVKGIFALKDLNGLKAKFTQINTYSNIGIMMENIPEGKVIKQAWIGTANAPDLSHFPQDDAFKSKVREKIKLIEKSLNDLQVKTDDLQLLVTKKGEVHLIDYDFYEWSFDEFERERLFRKNDLSNILSLFK